MSDLTRRVLAIVQTDPVVTVCTVPDNDVATLARQVEAVEEVLAWAEEPLAFRIRRALNEAEHEGAPND